MAHTLKSYSKLEPYCKLAHPDTLNNCQLVLLSPPQTLFQQTHTFFPNHTHIFFSHTMHISFKTQLPYKTQSYLFMTVVS